MQERQGVVTMHGNPVTLIGPEIKVGEKAPDFTVQATDLSEAKLNDFKGKLKLICSVPSLDTPVCDMEIHRFNQEASQIASDAQIIFISMDLPFAQKRFCAAAGINNVKTFSDHRYADFGRKYGVLIKDLRLLSRAIFIIDKDDVVRYVEYVKELGTEPDYQAALDALKSAASPASSPAIR
ncbi:MAG TPA: thiol peroxidase [Candidatus Margulisiibacteriota bacterium]|nr:thiol peroxidase [Candidatus Margulisiibacteriota bacterium]